MDQVFQSRGWPSSGTVNLNTLSVSAVMLAPRQMSAILNKGLCSLAAYIIQPKSRLRALSSIGNINNFGWAIQFSTGYLSIGISKSIIANISIFSLVIYKQYSFNCVSQMAFRDFSNIWHRWLSWFKIRSRTPVTAIHLNALIFRITVMVPPGSMRAVLDRSLRSRAHNIIKPKSLIITRLSGGPGHNIWVPIKL